MSPLLHPDRFQGSRRRRSYFEGWYFKQAQRNSGAAWSFIPGIAWDSEGRGEAFVQAIDGSTGTTRYFPHPVGEFEARKDRFEVRVGESEFSLSGARLRLGSGSERIEADLKFSGARTFPATLLSPGIMGPYAWVPFMECRHGLVSLDHAVAGEIRVDGRRIDMDGARGYIEKDWGSSMPSSWIWSQSNDFEVEGDSFMLSVARIPWLGSSFTGFLCVLAAGARLWRFATYTGHRLSALAIGPHSVEARIEGRGQVLRVVARRERSGLLAAPVQGSMSRRIAEAIDARLSVDLEAGGERIWSGTATRAGLELVGDGAELGATAMGA